MKVLFEDMSFYVDCTPAHLLDSRNFGLMRQIIWYSVIGWIIVGMIFVLVLNTVSDPMHAIVRVSSVVLCQIALYFANLLYFIPELLEKGRKNTFLFWLLSTVAIYVIGMGSFDIWLDGHMPFHRHPIGEKPFILIYLFRFLSAIPPLVISALIVKSVLLSQKTKESLELRNRMLEAETKALKAQINPHFLFNTLNNIYSLSQIKSDKTGTAIMNLSEILRYVTYESNQTFVSLNSEIRQIKNFIELQYLKDDEHDNIRVRIDVAQNSCEIAPLLLIPFIENSFKHSNYEDKENGWIDISIRLEDNNLWMICKNSIPAQEEQKDTTGGVGLENVRKRLNLLYPDKHELEIKKSDRSFKVELKIDLSK